MRITFTGALFRALAAARPPKPPPTITMRGIDSLILYVLFGKRRSGLLRLLHPKFHELQKSLIPHLSQLIHRATVRLFDDAGYDCFLAALRPFRECAKVLPPQR